MQSDQRRFRDARGLVRLVLSAPAYQEIVAAADAAYPLEAGGVLVGVYEECAVYVRHASRPPEDSLATATTFDRGTHGLLHMLRDRWRFGEYYVGEWHAHPDAHSEPSSTDVRSLQAIANTETLQCTTPTLVVLGGSKADRALSALIRWNDGAIDRLIDDSE